MRIKELNILAYAGSFTLHHFYAEDDDIAQDGYFNNAWKRMSKGDVLIVTRSGPKTEFYTVVDSSKEGVEIRAVGSEHNWIKAQEKVERAKKKDKEAEENQPEDKDK